MLWSDGGSQSEYLAVIRLRGGLETRSCGQSDAIAGGVAVACAECRDTVSRAKSQN